MTFFPYPGLEFRPQERSQVDPPVGQAELAPDVFAVAEHGGGADVSQLRDLLGSKAAPYE